MLGTKEHQDIMQQFEKEFRGMRLDHESREDWKRGIIYQDGHVNQLFLAYRKGYAFRKAVEILEAA